MPKPFFLATPSSFWERLLVFTLFAALCLVGFKTTVLALQSRADNLALQVTREIREQLYLSTSRKSVSGKKNAAGKKNIFFLKKSGPAQLEFFPSVILPEGIVIDYFVRVHRMNRELIFLAVHHKNGTHRYRWVDLYGQRVQQKIKL